MGTDPSSSLLQPARVFTHLRVRGVVWKGFGKHKPIVKAYWCCVLNLKNGVGFSIDLCMSACLREKLLEVLHFQLSVHLLRLFFPTLCFRKLLTTFFLGGDVSVWWHGFVFFYYYLIFFFYYELLQCLIRTLCLPSWWISTANFIVLAHKHRHCHKVSSQGITEVGTRWNVWAIHLDISILVVIP